MIIPSLLVTANLPAGATSVSRYSVAWGSFSKENPDYAKNPDIKWNFTKFLISKDGTKIQRFEPTSEPEEIAASIEALL